jgi:hypothetical protein
LISRSLQPRRATPRSAVSRAWCRKSFGVTPVQPSRSTGRRCATAARTPEDRPDLPNNERLEFLGDAVLDAVIGELLFEKYPKEGEGFLTRMRSKVDSN